MQHKKQIQDFIEDKSFINYVHQTNEVDTQKWTKWLKENANYHELVEEARQMVLGIPFEQLSVSSEKIEQGFDRLMRTLEETEPAIAKSNFLKLNWRKVAATVLLCSLGVWGGYQFFNQPELIVHTTSAGETERIILPDGSKVHLNANSRLTYYNDFANLKKKITNLEGEAYFEIEKMSSEQQLQIRTDNLSVEVTGTKFNLNSRRAYTVVSLDEGTVQLKTVQDKQANLKAGEVAWFDNERAQFIINKGGNQLWDAWREKQWFFGEDANFAELLRRIEETYGLKATVLDSALLERGIPNEIDIESKEVLFEAIESLYDIHILEKDSEHIMLQPQIEEQ